MIDLDYMIAVEELNQQFSAGQYHMQLSVPDRFEYLQKRYPDYHLTLNYIPEISPDVLTLRMHMPDHKSIGIRMMSHSLSNDEEMNQILKSLEQEIKKGENT